jgi:hypothetical protein
MNLSKLLLISTIFVSCGKGVETPIMSLMQEWGEEKNEEAYESIVGAKLRMCGERMYNYSCTNAYPAARLLQPYELFSHYCYESYLNCLEN